MIPVLCAMFLYALFHSSLAGRGKTLFRQQFGERAYHGLYRLIYNVIAAVTLLPVIWLVAERPGAVIWVVSLDLEPLLLLLQGVGLVGVTAALLQIDLLRFAGLTNCGPTCVVIRCRCRWKSCNTRPLQRDPPPLYLFSLLVVWPVTTMTAAYLGFALGVTCYFFIGAYYEEKRMLAAFGRPYAAYKARVPWVRFPLMWMKHPADKT
ncbi:hypothetical protein HC928_23695 [bacterium]|nr:hypothetical protein [bacterium]